MKPSFFKILINDFSTRLQIPPTFIKQFGKDMPEETIIETYFNKSWKVEVEKLDNKFYFSKDWRIFVEHNRLEHGDFLVFKYLTDHLKFKVKIYGKTCCEKQFDVGSETCYEPLKGEEDQRKGQDGGKRKRNEEADNVNGDGESKGAKRSKTGFDRSKAFERDIVNIDSSSSSSSASSSSSSDDDDDIGDVRKSTWKQETKEQTIQLKKNEIHCTLPPHHNNQIEFTSENPFFQVQLKFSSVIDSLYIPAGFFRQHLMMKENKKIKFEISQKSWNMELHVMERESATKRKLKVAKVNQEWKRLVKEHGVLMGDVCFFEMITSDDFESAFRVHVYRWDRLKAEFSKIF